MMNKRDFLKSGGAALAAGAGTGTALAAVRPSLDAAAGLGRWQAHVGQRFDIDGHAVTLQAVRTCPSRQRGEQFSLHFAGELPATLGDALRTLTHKDSGSMPLYLARTPQGLRADFCRLQGDK